MMRARFYVEDTPSQPGEGWGVYDLEQEGNRPVAVVGSQKEANKLAMVKNLRHYNELRKKRKH